GGNDQQAFDAEEASHNLGGGDGLNRFPQPHFIADEGTPRLGGKQSSFSLIVVQIDTQQVFKGGTLDPAWKCLVDRTFAILGIADFGHEGKDIILTAQVRIVMRSVMEKSIEL